MRGDLYLEERLAVLYHMLNEQSLVFFPRQTPRQREFIHRLLAVNVGDRRAVPRRYRARLRKLPRRT